MYSITSIAFLYIVEISWTINNKYDFVVLFMRDIKLQGTIGGAPMYYKCTSGHVLKFENSTLLLVRLWMQGCIIINIVLNLENTIISRYKLKLS
jgi:hypothetical protein